MARSRKAVVSQERIKQLLSYDPETGVFRWLVNRGCVKAGNIAGSKNVQGYLQIQIDGENYFAHRLALIYVNGSIPDGHTDHINGKRDDNRACNLRSISCAANIQNQIKAPSTSTSEHLGVSKSGNRWRAYIRAFQRQVHLGCFATREEAAQAYLVAKRKWHPGCTI